VKDSTQKDSTQKPARASDRSHSNAQSEPAKPLRWEQTEGCSLPFGATWVEKDQAFNFAIYAEHAVSVTLLFYAAPEFVTPAYVYTFDFLRNKSGRIWHCRVPIAAIRECRYYAYSVSGEDSPGVHGFDPQKIVLDPYAKGVFFPPAFDRKLAMREGPNAGAAPLGVLPGRGDEFDWNESTPPHHEADAIIYELHVKGFTQNPNSGVDPSRAGTYAGLVDKIPYLKDLGVTVVELMPIFQRDPQEGDYWGYMPLNFFSPHAQYAGHRDQEQYIEFKSMVKAFHEAGIGIVLDVVYNHTCEGDHRGPIYSYKGLGSATYYMMSSDPANPYANYSGTGNTLNFGRSHVRKMAMDSLRYWKKEMHIDGFRFDLASVFSRNADGSLNWGRAPIFAEIAADPELGQLRLIAEPWDTGAYQLGRGFPGITWLQWNGRFRDDVRRFVKGDADMVPDLMRRIYGSDDFFPDNRDDAYHAFQSVNYLTSHDGFTLYDLVSYNEKHNWANGQNNQDGMNDNYSWNCGHEGDAGAPAEVLALRRRQVKNFFCLLMVSNGTPMFRAGDEFLNTQFGNNNPYNQDNPTGWLDWSQLQSNQDIFRFFKGMIAFRKNHPTLSRSRFWREDVNWYGTGAAADLSGNSRSLAFCLRGASQNDQDIYVMINAYWESLEFQIQEGAASEWSRIADTALPSPNDLSNSGEPLKTLSYSVAPRSVVVLLRSK
jgi:isoamylase